MPDEKTKADSIRQYLSSASVDGGAQTNPDASLGNFRSSTEVVLLSHTVSNPIANITVDYLSGANGTGSGSLTATGVDDLTWAPPGGSAGAAVTILNGETKILEGSGATGKFIRVTRTSTANLTGTATLTITDKFNNLIGFDNVTSAEASAGDTEYRAMFIKNESTSQVKNIKAFLAKLGTSRLSGGGGLPASGAGSVTTSVGNFSDWPTSGFCRIEDTAGVIKEIVYYSSRTSTILTVPAAGRGLLGTAAVAGVVTDNIHSVPGIRIAKEAPASQPTGAVQTVANENTAPTAVTFVSGILNTTGLTIGDLNTLEIYAIWIERVVPVGAIAEASVSQKINIEFEAA